MSHEKPSIISLSDLVKRLDKDYPNDAILLKDKSEVDRERYIAQLELIEEIKYLTGMKD